MLGQDLLLLQLMLLIIQFLLLAETQTWAIATIHCPAQGIVVIIHW
jgi:hypothetical protein